MLDQAIAGSSADRIDGLVDALDRGVSTWLPRGPLKDLAHGVWLGHPLHPVLSDLPIGFWTSAWVLDIAGGARAEPAADALVGLGVLSAAPTVIAGAADWSELDRPARRDGVVHALANATATVLYAASFVSRRAGHRRIGVALGFAGAAAATAGGYLGGHLVFRRGAGVDRATDAPTVDGEDD